MPSTTRARVALSVTAAAGLVFGMAGFAQAAPTPNPGPSSTVTGPATPTPSVPVTAKPTAPGTTSTVASTPTASATNAASGAGPTSATPSATAAKTAGAAATVAPTDPRCTTTKTLTIFNFNDFHGRIDTAAKLFTPVQAEKAANPGNVMLLSAGDNIGASTFVSMLGDDMPTIQILNDAGLQASSVGNHEFDGGWAKLRDKYIPAAKFPYLAANMTGVAPAIQPYTIINQNGVRVAVIGAEVSDLPNLVSPAGIAGITVSPEVAAVNSVADQIRSQGLADVVVAEVHNNLQSGYNANVDVIFNGHTHETYSNTTPGGQPVLQAASYGTKLGRVDLKIGTGNVICGPAVGQIVSPAATANMADPVIAKIDADYQAAKAAADQIGSQVIGQACGPIQRAVNPNGGENRSAESTATDLVAEMFYERLANGDPNFIGMQNPGGTRADIAGGAITYAQANAVLPFANTLMTTKITGAQLKTVLEEQWQRDKTGAVPARPYLQLGLSNNVTYTYDESLPEGQRITSITVSGKPYDPAATYTVGSGSFLITGGDNFHELAKGTATTDTGKIDLSEWVAWIKATTAAKGNICNSTARQAVTVSLPATKTVSCSASTTITVGQPLATGVAKDTLNYTQGVAPETTITAYAGTTPLGTFPVTNGVATVTVQAPAGGTTAQPLTLKTGNGTVVSLGSAGMTVAACAAGATPTATPTTTPTTDAGTAPAPDQPAATDAGDQPGLSDTGGESANAILLLSVVALAGAGVANRRR